jgi:hypothetical protein
MTISLDRRIENSYIASYIKVTKAGVDVLFGSLCLSNLNTNKKIGTRKITAEIDPKAIYPVNLQKGYSTNQNSSYDTSSTY